MSDLFLLWLIYSKNLALDPDLTDSVHIHAVLWVAVDQEVWGDGSTMQEVRPHRQYMNGVNAIGCVRRFQ